MGGDLSKAWARATPEPLTLPTPQVGKTPETTPGGGKPGTIDTSGITNPLAAVTDRAKEAKQAIKDLSAVVSGSGEALRARYADAQAFMGRGSAKARAHSVTSQTTTAAGLSTLASSDYPDMAAAPVPRQVIQRMDGNAGNPAEKLLAAIRDLVTAQLQVGRQQLAEARKQTTAQPATRGI